MFSETIYLRNLACSGLERGRSIIHTPSCRKTNRVWCLTSQRSCIILRASQPSDFPLLLINTQPSDFLLLLTNTYLTGFFFPFFFFMAVPRGLLAGS